MTIDTLWCASVTNKLYRNSGQFTSTILASINISAADTLCTGISADRVENGIWCGRNADILKTQSGTFSTKQEI